MRTINDEILEDENVKHWISKIIGRVRTYDDDHIENALHSLIDRVIQICKTDAWARRILDEQAKEQELHVQCSLCNGEGWIFNSASHGNESVDCPQCEGEGWIYE